MTSKKTLFKRFSTCFASAFCVLVLAFVALTGRFNYSNSFNSITAWALEDDSSSVSVSSVVTSSSVISSVSSSFSSISVSSSTPPSSSSVTSSSKPPVSSSSVSSISSSKPASSVSSSKPASSQPTISSSVATSSVVNGSTTTTTRRASSSSTSTSSASSNSAPFADLGVSSSSEVLAEGDPFGIVQSSSSTTQDASSNTSSNSTGAVLNIDSDNSDLGSSLEARSGSLYVSIMVIVSIFFLSLAFVFFNGKNRAKKLAAGRARVKQDMEVLRQSIGY
jgi:hypothetical protein